MKQYWPTLQPDFARSSIVRSDLLSLSSRVRYLSVPFNKHFDMDTEAKYRYASLNDEDTFREMRRYAISSLCERHRVYLHKPR